MTGLTIIDGILLISSIAVPYTEPMYETHSEPGIGYRNSGVWQGNYFLADYTRCTPELDCYTGQTKIGPFEHYPGSPNYTGYTTWVEDNTQYVKTHYSHIVNEYPAEVDYKINTSSWATITNNLGSGTTSTIIPASSLVVGLNILQFQESNSYDTKFEWALYLNQGSTPESYTTHLTYDCYGNMTSMTNALGNTTTFGYDLYHLYVASVTDTLNQAIIPVYDIDTGLLTSVTNPKGQTTFFEYDILGRVTKKINPDLTEKEAVYDDLNNCITLYDELPPGI